MNFEFRMSMAEAGGVRPSPGAETLVPTGRPIYSRIYRQPTVLRPKTGALRGRPAFTLLELLVVVAIMGIVMTISVPFMNSAINGNKGMTGAVKGVQEASKFARDWAILQQTPHELRIRPAEGVFEVSASSSAGDGMIGGGMGNSGFSPSVEGKEWRMGGKQSGGGGGGSFTMRLPDGVVIEGLGVNGEDWTEDEVARVRFYPNGTCDEMSVVLYEAESGLRRNIYLEVVTGLSDIETDPNKFKVR